MKVQVLRRIALYCVGLFIMSVGIVMAVKGNLGVAPLNALPYVLSVFFEVDLGVMTSGFLIFVIILQAVFLRRDFKMTRCLQFICSFLLGGFVSLNTRLLFFIPDVSFYPVQILYLIVSMLLVAFGLFLYLACDFFPLPPEGMMQVISQKWGLRMSQSKVIFDCVSVGLAALLSLAFWHGLVGVREGTVIAAILVGRIMGIFDRAWGARLRAWLGVEPNPIKTQMPQPAKSVDAGRI